MINYSVDYLSKMSANEMMNKINNLEIILAGKNGFIDQLNKEIFSLKEDVFNLNKYIEKKESNELVLKKVNCDKTNAIRELKKTIVSKDYRISNQERRINNILKENELFKNTFPQEKSFANSIINIINSGEEAKRNWSNELFEYVNKFGFKTKWIEKIDQLSN